MRLIASACVTLGLAACGGSSSSPSVSTPAPVAVPPPTLELFAGSPVESTNADGHGAAARFTRIFDMVLDDGGNLLVIDGNRVRKVTPAGDVSTLSTVTSGESLTAIAFAGGRTFLATQLCFGAAVGTSPSICDGGLLELDSTGATHPVSGIIGTALIAIVALPAGVIAIADRGSSRLSPAVGHILKFSPAATSAIAHLDHATGMALAPDGTLVVSTEDMLARVTPAGAVAQVAALATPGLPSRVSVDALGIIYVADNATATVRRVATGGDVTTVVGTPGFDGFTPGPLPGTIGKPMAIAVSGTNLYIAMGTAIAVVRNRP